LADGAVRDKALAQAQKHPIESPIRRFAPILVGWLTKGMPDDDAIDAVRDWMNPRAKAVTDLYVGWALATRGETDRAIARWEACARGDIHQFFKTHANAFLAEDKAWVKESAPKKK
jgi:hypothetical protein